MGRIVYFSLPTRGHVNPTLGVIRELVRRGHEIVYYCTEQFRQDIEGTSALFRVYSPGFQWPEEGPGPFAQVSTTLETLLALSCSTLDHHLEEVRALQPTHVMYDSFAPWGGFFAQLLRLPSIASVPSILVNGDIDARYGARPGGEVEDPRLTPEWYAAFRARSQASLGHYGITETSPPKLLQSYGDLNVVYTSRLFQPSAEAFDGDRIQFVGPCIEFRPQAAPFQFERLDGRPLVLVSLGTVYGNPRFFRECMEQLADAPWQVVLSTGVHYDLGPLPSNFIVRYFVPQIELLRRAAAFVTHAGMNSVQEALYHGVPMVMAPQAADQFWISGRVAELGAGLVLESGAIRSSVAKVLVCADYRAASERIGGSLRAAGGHMRAADEIERFMNTQAGKIAEGEADQPGNSVECNSEASVSLWPSGKWARTRRVCG